MKPAMAQAPISSAGESTSRAISAETIKIPEPIIDPITSMVALVSPSPLTSSLSCWLWMSQSLLAVGCAIGVLRKLLLGGGQPSLVVAGRAPRTLPDCSILVANYRRPTADDAFNPDDFTSRCGKIPLLICGAPVTSPISRPRSPPPP